MFGLAFLTLTACGPAANFSPVPEPSNTETTVAANTPTAPSLNTLSPAPNSKGIVTSTPTITVFTVAPPTNTPSLPTPTPMVTSVALSARNQLVATTGCGQAAPIKPGTSQNVTIA